MPNLTSVTVTAGVPTAGTGTVSTLDNLVGTAGTGSAQVLTVQGSASGTAIPVSLASAPSTAVTNAGTFATQSAQSGTWTVQPGNTANTTAWKVDGSAVTQPVSLATLPVTNAGTFATQSAQSGTWTVQPGNTANTTAWKVDNTAALDKGTGTGGSATQRVILDSTQLGTLGRTTPASSVPVVAASQTYETVAASQTAQVLGGSGATGDYIDSILVIPATTSPGNVLLLDNATSITVFTGGATSVSNLVPFTISLGMVSASGAWKITTGANVSVIGIGNFT